MATALFPGPDVREVLGGKGVIVIVYCVTNLVNGKRYVGKTTATLKHRWAMHWSEAGHGSENPFHRALRKYGKPHFVVEVITECSSLSELSEKEKCWIVALSTHVSTGRGYNATWGGDGTEPGRRHPNFGKHLTDEVKAKLRRSKLGKPNPSALAKGEGHWNRRRIRSKETKEKIRIARAQQIHTNRGMHHTDETKDKLRTARKNQATTPAMLSGLEKGWIWTAERKLKHSERTKKMWASKRKSPNCLVGGCNKAVGAHGLCAAHAQRMKRHGNPLGGNPRRGPLPGTKRPIEVTEKILRTKKRTRLGREGI
jgi:group I intron endonuclease